MLNSGMAKCPCGQTFNYRQDRDMKFRMYHKVCPKLVGSKNIRVPKESYDAKYQHYDAERMQRVHKHHEQYLSNWDRYYHF